MSNLNMAKMRSFIKSANIRIISKIWLNSEDLIYFWTMDSLESYFQLINTSIPEIYEFIDIDNIKNKAYRIRNERVVEKKIVISHRFLNFHH